MEKAYDIVGIGEILVEVLAKDKNQPFYEPGILLGPYPSGAPAICIDQAARMGAKTALVSKIGQDDFGRINTDRLKEGGTDTSYIVETDRYTTGTAFVTYFDNGDRQFIYHFAYSASGFLEPQEVPEALIKNTKILHIMGCSITASDSLRRSIMQVAKIATENGVKISFDPNIRKELLKAEEIKQSFQEILNMQSILLTGLKEIEEIYACNYQEAVDKLLSENPERIIVLKDGSRGTRVYSKDEAFSIGTFPAEEVDPTGAGDCFDGTFLAMLCQGSSLEDATRYGNAAGALGVTKRGPMEGNSNKEKVESFMQDSPSPSFKKLR